VGFEPCEQFKPSQVKWVHTFNVNPLNIFGKLIYSHRLLKYDLFPMPSLLIHAMFILVIMLTKINIAWIRREGIGNKSYFNSR
jgi:hypothetical protein